MLRLIDPRRVAHRRLLALTQQVPLALAGEVEGVHQARVASRRLREFLPLLEPVPDHPRAVGGLRRRVRRLTRAFGPVRELDVALLTLDDLAERRPADGAAIALVRTTIVGDRTAVVERLEATLSRADFGTIRDRMATAAAAFVSPAARRTMAASLSARVGQRAEAARTAVDAAGTLYAADRLHRARIALKKLRYTLELAEECGRFRLAGTLRRLKGVQDILGVLHDDDVLAGRVRDCAAGTSDAGEQARLAALALDLDEEIRLRHSEFLHAKPALGVVFFWASRTCASLNRSPARRTRRRGEPPRVPEASDA